MTLTNQRQWILMTSLQYRGNIFRIFSSNSEAFASELLENIRKIFPQYCIHYDMFSI